jgi:transglutaminase-like putative cysteine protease
MWLTVEHVTRYAYDAPINEAYTEVRLKPLHRDGQRCSSFTLATEPRGATVDEYRDRYGNTVHHFDLLEVHESLSVTVRSEVWTTSEYVAEEPVLSPLDRWDYLAGTRYVGLDQQVVELAAATPAPSDPVEGAWELMRAVRAAMTYERGTTHVHTTAAEALADGRGVCQDFAHVMIGACRSRGVPARYVSGYLHDTRANGGEGESHAWVDVHVGDTWISLDPTHDTAQTERYVRVGVGRDYADVPPSRGVYRGTATETLEVAVTIREP